MKNSTRELLISDVERKANVPRRAARRAVDQVLDEVLAMVTPVLEREWSGSEVIQKLQQWRGRR